jgi:hypothetical protein
MATFKFKNNEGHFNIRHRVVCDNDNFKGPWHDNENDCYPDAKKHRNKPGNENHVLRIVAEQTVIKVLKNV